MSQSDDLVVGHVVGGGVFEWMIYHQCLFKRLLNEFSEGAVTINSGSVFHVSPILLLKLLLIIYNRALRLNSLCHVAVLALENVSKVSVSTLLSISVMIL